MHKSYRPCLSLNQLFGATFPDSEIPKNIKMSKTKASYVVVFGLAEYFYINLTNFAKQSLFLSLLFLKLGFTRCKAKQPLLGMELQGKEV